MNLVLAANYKEFKQSPFNNLDHKYLGVLPDDLIGHSNCELIAYGRFWMRGDYKPEEIYSYCKNHNISLSQVIINDVKGTIVT